MILIKNEEQIKKIAESSRVVALVHDELKKVIKPGVTLESLNVLAEKIIEDNGGVPSFKGYQGYPESICTSVNEVLIHGIPSKQKLINGDLIKVDVGVYKDGYHGDAAFSMLVGNKVNEEAEQISHATQYALQEVINVIKPGDTFGTIGSIIQSIAELYGYGIPSEFSGHGIGEQLHEEPHVSNKGLTGEGDIILPGMVFCIEPMFMKDTSRVIISKKDG
ncbi:MAG: type I methionyl aminopeptidase [Tenericutes bacterium]|nr:MAG: type I methionyl aminopeptidase [Mycoplasmatota bacterium]